MELTELIINYINNPTEELKENFERTKKTSSSINLVYTITKLNDIIEIEEDETKKDSLIQIQKELVSSLKDEPDNNYIFDEETNRIVRKR